MLTIRDTVKITPEIESVTSIQEAFEGRTLKCAHWAVRSTLEGRSVVLDLHRVAQAQALEVSGTRVWFAVALATYINIPRGLACTVISSCTTLLKYFHCPNLGDTELRTTGQTPLESTLYILTAHIVTPTNSPLCPHHLFDPFLATTEKRKKKVRQD